jgi:3-polyprenyl-4-hydroxybenzoate decarboxylase
LDELAVADALAGSAIDVLRAARPSISLCPRSPEAPFGESHGYVNLQEYNAFMRVTAITRRRNPILTSFISQVAPSESSVIRRVTMEALFLNYLRNGLSIKASSASRYTSRSPIYIAIQFERGTREPEVWRALNGVSTLHRFASKWVIAIDDDIDPDNADALFWAMSYRCQPQHDIQVVPHKNPGHGPRGPRDNGEGASVLINALLESRTAPIALPRREYMENAKALWERLGLPPLKPDRRGMATSSATGRRKWRGRRTSPRAANTFRLARSLRSRGAPASR